VFAMCCKIDERFNEGFLPATEHIVLQGSLGLLLPSASIFPHPGGAFRP
jgi:hypothetical protein